jgi:hypothetical protein
MFGFYENTVSFVYLCLEDLNCFRHEVFSVTSFSDVDYRHFCFLSHRS